MKFQKDTYFRRLLVVFLVLIRRSGSRRYFSPVIGGFILSRSHQIFISSKNLDENGNPTQDIKIAEELYHFLSDKGLNVFLSNIILENLGISLYQKAIDDALDSSIILIAVGTSRGNLESQWVRYEWDSFMNDIRTGIKPNGRVFILTDGMNIKDLPRALRYTQVLKNENSNAKEKLYRFIINSLNDMTLEEGIEQLFDSSFKNQYSKNNKYKKISFSLVIKISFLITILFLILISILNSRKVIDVVDSLFTISESQNVGILNSPTEKQFLKKINDLKNTDDLWEFLHLQQQQGLLTYGQSGDFYNLDDKFVVIADEHKIYAIFFFHNDKFLNTKNQQQLDDLSNFTGKRTIWIELLD